MDKKPNPPAPFPTREGGERLHHVQLLLSAPFQGGLGKSKCGERLHHVQLLLSPPFQGGLGKSKCGERLHHVQLLLSPPFQGGLGGSKRDANKVRYPLTRGFTHRYTRKNCQDSPPLVGEGLGERFYLILSTNLSISHPTSHE